MGKLEFYCDACSGNAMVTAPEWSAWYDKRGKSGHDWLAFERANPAPDGPEEIECGECKATGYVPTDEGRALLAFIARHQVITVRAEAVTP